MNTHSITFRVHTWEEFKAKLIAAIAHDFGHRSKEEIVESFLDNGVIELKPDNLGITMKSLQLRCYMPPTVVDFGSADWYWLVAGTDAILVPKPGGPMDRSKKQPSSAPYE